MYGDRKGLLEHLYGFGPTAGVELGYGEPSQGFHIARIRPRVFLERRSERAHENCDFNYLYRESFVIFLQMEEDSRSVRVRDFQQLPGRRRSRQRQQFDGIREMGFGFLRTDQYRIT
jgi:hypothetical protein